MKNVPVNRPSISKEELTSITKCIKSGWISADGPIVNSFEKEFAKKVSRKYSVAVSSGTAAIDIAVRSLNLKKGDEIIIPAFTIISTINQIIREGLVPVLVDSNALTWNVDVTKIKSKITKKTKAIMVVHIYGLPVEIDPVIQIAKKYKLYVIEDAAEQLGQTYKKKKIGSFGDISTFSFFANKHITTGEGGMIVTNNLKLFEKFKILRNLSFNPQKQKFIHDEIGWNYRMTSMQASLGLAQLKKLNLFVKKKREIGKYYNEKFSKIKNFQLPLKKTTYATNIYWVYGILIKKNNLNGKKCISLLKKHGIESRPFFCPMHLQPIFKKMKLFKNQKYPIAEKLYKDGFYIPSGLGTTKKELEKVAKVICKIFSSN
tara:strand:+ start:1916 stop:3037 length:1122 start_codon:yes stop_codon:yes gene_type:complete